MVLSTTCALAQRHERRGREGIITTNTDNMYARQQCEREGKRRIKITHRKRNVGARRSCLSCRFKKEMVFSTTFALAQLHEREINTIREQCWRAHLLLKLLL